MMNSSSLHKARKKKHAGHTVGVSSEAPISSPITLIRSSLIGLGCTVVIGLLFLLIAASAAHASSDPGRLTVPLAYTALYASALFAGIITVRIHGHSALVCGILAGILLLLTGFLTGMVLPSDAAAVRDHSILPSRLPIPLLSIAGAYLARKRPPSRRRGHR